MKCANLKTTFTELYNLNSQQYVERISITSGSSACSFLIQFHTPTPTTTILIFSHHGHIPLIVELHINGIIQWFMCVKSWVRLPALSITTLRLIHNVAFICNFPFYSQVVFHHIYTPPHPPAYWQIPGLIKEISCYK